MVQTRLHALDAVRGIALLLGLVLHGSMSFWPGLAAANYPMLDNSPSLFLQILFYVLHMFRMAVFFVIAGFFAHLLLNRKGSREFIRDRLHRIALPMVVAWLVSLVLIIPIALWAAFKLYGDDFLVALQAQSQMAAGASVQQPFLMHFWFLYYLLWYYAIAVLCSLAKERLDPKGRVISAFTALVYFLSRTPLLLLVATVISATIFYQRDNWQFWVGIPTPTEAVWNEAPAFIIYGLAFLLGWVFDRERDCLALLRKYWLRYAIPAILMTAYCITWLDMGFLEAPRVTATEKGLYAFVYALASWAWIFALIGAGMQFFDKESEARRYIADASYWVYIAHIPLLFFLQTLIMDWPVHWSIKFPLILAIATPLLFWSYDKFVRYSFIGTTLNGPRQRKSANDEALPVTT